MSYTPTIYDNLRPICGNSRNIKNKRNVYKCYFGRFCITTGRFIGKPCGLHELKQFAHTSPALFRCCARAQPS